MQDELYEGFRLDEEELDNAPTGEEEEKEDEDEVETPDEEEAV